MEENKLLNVSSSPHVRDKSATSRIMMDVFIALLPATLFGIWNFGFRALLVVVVSVAASVLSEFLYELLMKKPITVRDFSAALTGLLIGLNMPVTIPLWMVILGDAFAIIVVKQLFGGLGQNFMNPALAARCFLLISFPKRMAAFAYDGAGLLQWLGTDAVTSATPMGLIKTGESVDVLSMFLGTTGGVIGETSVVALLIGAVYLFVRKVIVPTIPCVYIGVFSICIALYMLFNPSMSFDVEYLLAQLCGGGLILGAFFMATDYVTSPVTPWGKVIFGALLGLLTFIFRIFGSGNEGVSYAIIFGNLLVPLIEKITVPKVFGVVKEKKNKKEAV